MANTTTDKLIFTTGQDSHECGTIIRIKPRAAVCLTDLMRRTGKSTSEIASAMIEYAYKHIEVR